jgi:alanine dehydrogenase
VRLGVPRETKPGERRVGLDPQGVAMLVREGFAVSVESGAGLGIAAEDQDYRNAGAAIVDRAVAWGSDLVVKVKELQPGEANGVPRGTAVFSFQHLVGAPDAVRELAHAGLTAIAYEMVRDNTGRFPILAPMSELAGQLAIEAAVAHGRDVRRVLILGAGRVARAAADTALDHEMQVTVLCSSATSQASLREAFGGDIATGLATPGEIAVAALTADALVGAVFAAGLPTPKLVTRALLARMKPGSVLVDVCIEEGGIAETSRRTTHDEPTFVEEGIVHYGVGNMPAAVPHEATRALSNAVMPYLRRMKAVGVRGAIAEDAGLRAGVLLWEGHVVDATLARESGLPLGSIA